MADVWEYAKQNLHRSFLSWERRERVRVLLGFAIAAMVAALPVWGLKAAINPSSNELAAIGFVAWFLALVLVVTPYRMWKEQRQELVKLRARKLSQGHLDEVSELRTEAIVLRNGMRHGDHPNKTAEEWGKEFHALEKRIADKIAEFSSVAEANIYKARGNLQRRMGTTLPAHQVYDDILTHDIDYLRTFIQDYSRNRERGA